MTVWMSKDTAKKSRYASRTLGGILGIAALMLLLCMAGVALVFRLDLPRGWASLAICLFVTALAVLLSTRLGRRSLQDATVFLLDDRDRLFALDARREAGYHSGALGGAETALDVQEVLREFRETGALPGSAEEIRKVISLRENRRGYVLRCRVRLEDGSAGESTYFLIKGYEAEELLLRQLERRQLPEKERSRGVLTGLIASLVVLVSFLALCALSHPAVGRLSQSLYFPCLGAAFLSIFFVSYFAVRRHRGE